MKLTQKQIAELCTQKGNLKRCYENVLHCLDRPGKKHLKRWGNNFRKLDDQKYNHLIELLDILKIKYSEGNSKDGGAESDFIEIRRRHPAKLKAVKGLIHTPV